MILAEVFEKAADIIETDGHNKGAYEDPDTGSMCALGALCAAAAEYRYRDAFADARDTLAKRVAPDLTPVLMQVFDPWETVVSWNDAPERTATEVIDTFKHLAKDMRNGS